MERERKVLLESYGKGSDSASHIFSDPVDEITAYHAAEVVPALARVEELVSRGYHAAGFIAYEAASGLRPELVTRPPMPGMPLVLFTIFKTKSALAYDDNSVSGCNNEYRAEDWTVSVTRDRYGRCIQKIRDYIAAGDTYQVNFTVRQRFSFTGSAYSYYRELCRAQRADYCAFIDTGRYAVLSASPELFFSLREGILTTRPMKGTARRGRWPGEDAALRQALVESAKDRAENVMIVDLLRNDLGVISETGTVRTESLFDVETLETVHQMTSTVTSRIRPGVGLTELFRALFPCGSVTGAPKRRTMEIIRELEDSPRGVYTGALGYISPGPEAVFSVAIRTVVIDRQEGRGELGIGSGVTWYSSESDEYDESVIKGRFAREAIPEFSLIESFLFEEGTGYFLLDRHLERLDDSAAYFGFSCDREHVRQSLLRYGEGLKGSCKVRLLLDRKGGLTFESVPVVASSAGETAVAFAHEPVDSANIFLYHKTTNREFYAKAIEMHPGCGEVIFVNERGEVTEGANSNIVVRIGAQLCTPPVASGLLAGTFREELLQTGKIRERVISRKEVEDAEVIYLINSVRKWRKARLIKQ